MCIFFLYLFLTFLSDFIIVTINLIQLLAAILIRINYLSIYLSILKQPRGDGERYVTPARAAAKETIAFHDHIEINI